VVQYRGVMSVSVGIDSACDDAGSGDHVGHGRTSSSVRIQLHPLSWHTMLEWDGQASNGRLERTLL
jgi:hypothetical protein